MGKMQRDKGYRVENNLVHKHQALGVGAERVPLSGGAGGSYTGDLILSVGEETFRAEVKARARAAGWVTIKNWLDTNDLLFLVEDRVPPLVLMTWETYERLLASLKEVADDDSGGRVEVQFSVNADGEIEILPLDPDDGPGEDPDLGDTDD
jgi:hypothetical protein